MSDRSFVMDLGKLLIAIAWADGVVQPEEVNALKLLMLGVPDMRPEDWRELELYLDHPVAEAERERLLDNLVARIKTRAQKETVARALRALVEADGTVTAEEQAMLDAITGAVEARSTGTLSALVRLLGRAGARVSGKHAAVVMREDRMEDYVKNPVYFRLGHARDALPGDLGFDEAGLRKVCLAAALMAKVAYADEHVAAEESALIASLLRTDFRLPEGAAAAIHKLSIERGLDGLDAYRLGESFQAVASVAERTALMTSLFRVARAHGDASVEESEELRRISKCLGLSHGDLIAAKLTSRGEYIAGEAGRE